MSKVKHGPVNEALVNEILDDAEERRNRIEEKVADMCADYVQQHQGVLADATTHGMHAVILKAF